MTRTETLVDSIELTRSVMFVGDYFTLLTTVVLDENLRNDGETDEDMAVRIATILMEEHYGWDIADKSTSIGVMDDSYDE